MYSTVQRAYTHRSSHVNGSALSDENEVRAQEVLNLTWRFLRKILLYVLIEGISSQAKTRVFLKEIDLAFVDDKCRTKLEGKNRGSQAINDWWNLMIWTETSKTVWSLNN